MKPSIKYQTGAATLIFSVIILLVITFVTLFTAKSIITETKVSNNVQRSKIVFEAAEAGIARAFSAFKDGRRYNRYGGVFGDPTTKTDCFTNISFCTLNFAVRADPANTSSRVIANVTVIVDSNYIITSTGTSDDGSISKTITMNTSQATAIDNTPDNPMISRSNVSVTGATEVINQEGATTIWSGGGMTFGSAATGTYIADPDYATYPACMEDSFTCDVISASEGTTGVDIISNDDTLASLSNDEFFANFMGLGIADFRSSNAVTLNIDGNTAISPDGVEYNLNDYLDNPAPSEIVFVDGDARINGGTLGCTVDVAPNFTTSTNGQTQCDIDGGEVQSSILIVNGDLKINGSPHFFGIVIVLGDITAAGGFDVTGALMATGKVGESGNPRVWYNSNVIAGSNDATAINVVSGGWRDF